MNEATASPGVTRGSSLSAKITPTQRKSLTKMQIVTTTKSMFDTASLHPGSGSIGSARQYFTRISFVLSFWYGGRGIALHLFGQNSGVAKIGWLTGFSTVLSQVDLDRKVEIESSTRNQGYSHSEDLNSVALIIGLELYRLSPSGPEQLFRHPSRESSAVLTHIELNHSEFGCDKDVFSNRGSHIDRNVSF